METSRWERVQELFHELSDLSPEEQKLRLASEAPDLRDDVQTMLDEDREASLHAGPLPRWR